MNVGKKFETIVKQSIPSYCMLYRLKDTAQSYNHSQMTKFTWDNPCDFFCFNSKTHLLYAFELKSTKFKTMNFQKSKEDTSSKMIKYHQIESLKKMASYDGLIAGFILNFRDENKNMERTYFQDIKDFELMCQNIGKGSFNEIDLILYGNAIKIMGTKKRVNYQWDFDEFFKTIH